MLRRSLIVTGNLLRPRYTVCGRQLIRHTHQHDDKSIVKVLNMEMDSGLMIDAYSQLGFRLNNKMSVVGPIAIFPKTVLSWNVKYHTDINEDTLSMFYLLEPKIDILIIGTGDKGNIVDMNIIRFMKNKGITVELLPTESACTTFNFLNQERRYVAAALIPPMNLSITADDLMQAEEKRKRLYDFTKEVDDTMPM